MAHKYNEKLIYDLKLFNCKIWYINIDEYFKKAYKKNFLYGINFYMNKNKICSFLIKELKNILPLYCWEEIYFSRYKKNKDNNKIEFYIAFKSYSDLIRCFNIIIKFEKKLYKKIFSGFQKWNFITS